MRTRVVWLAVAITMATAAPALAEQGNRATARRHYAEGQALFQAGNYDAALAEFRMANDMAPHPITIKAQAECLERLGRTQEAVTMFERYLREAPNASDAAEIRARIEHHRSRPGRLQVHTTPPGATVILDGQQVRGATPLDLQVQPGPHAVAIQAQGYQMLLQEFTMPVAGSHIVNVRLVPEGGGQTASTRGGTGTTPTIPPTSQQPSERVQVTTPVWIMIGLTAAGLITGTVTGALALSDQGEFDDRVQTEGVSGDNRASLMDLGDSGEAKALVADISFGVAAAAAITGIVLFFVQNRNRLSRSGRASPRFSISPNLALDGDGGGLTAIGRF